MKTEISEKESDMDIDPILIKMCHADDERR
jgi:hypothetical protein